MSSSISDNDSDSEEISILDIIGSQKIPNTKKYKPKAQAFDTEDPSPVTSKKIHQGSNILSQEPKDEFDIELPTIFLTDAKKNEELAIKNAKIRADLVEDELHMQQKYKRLQQRKQEIIDELNDNGVIGQNFSLSNDRDNHFVERLLQSELKGSKTENLTQRHFYLYSSPPIQIDLNTKLPFPVNISTLCNELRPDNYENLYLNISSFFTQLVNYVLTNVQELNCLVLFSRFIEFLYKSRITSSDSITEKEFVNYIKTIGGEIKYIMPNSDLQMPLKLVHYNTQYRITTVRLSIIFHYILFAAKNDHAATQGSLYKTMLKTFILSLCDFNLNDGNGNELTTNFVTPVFINIVNWRRDELMKQQQDKTTPEEGIYVVHDLILSEINETIKRELHTCLYKDRKDSKTDKPKFRKIDYELHYNILRLLNLSIRFNSQPFCMRLVTSLCLTFMADSDYTLCDLYYREPTLEELNFGTCNFTPSFKFVISIINKLNALNTTECLGSNDIEQINSIYKNYYKLLLFNFVIFKTFHSNLNTVQNRQDYEKIKLSNYLNLKQLANTINKLKGNVHRQLGELSNISLISQSSPYKDDVIHIITEYYHLLHYLATKCDKDMMLIHKDTFYDDKSLQ